MLASGNPLIKTALRVTRYAARNIHKAPASSEIRGKIRMYNVGRQNAAYISAISVRVTKSRSEIIVEETVAGKKPL